MRLLSVTKPGIIFGNIVTACGGYFLGSQGSFSFITFVATIVGMSLVIACGCVINNCIDQDIDKLMARTKRRVSAQGLLSNANMILYGIVLGVLGVIFLYFFTNRLTVIVALVGLFVYIVLYSLWLKRTSIHGTFIGAISGAVPPVVGYCATTNRFDAGAVILFAILFLWQMPHSYAIAIFRLKDYKAANIPVLPVVKGIEHTKVIMCIYTVLFAIVVLLPTVFGYAGYIYLSVACVFGLSWLVLAIKGLGSDSNITWSRKMFVLSILGIMLLSVAMSV
ncbi:heme o synthase [Piscirickettsia salmonis]|uniref:Protoheme IX farnesyltransferase n=1 Tax=Piscirickettsia salmonis TaxID=1238 RepID=A0A1L6TFT7_PISSA|nr:heme o synthase [Piscirickettsia salmonis]AKP74821.1 protoheme IX farnesyltransferase [Piscirickettsia salmonis LF-89 = ATCC VR-1361]ALB21235.1 protoheme IX farnesyltransferase [Piscirickettsia salmonis]ALY01494.1 protoheme IX farnesyltransferase [Piscirickettsia salmonis]AMA41008.1 protoheme IX farnesyltransferase [Piscirickettsia salmonis]AOS36196.1 protoheme IX farnesyltransferase [Piscirickettsia salmonis]